MNRKIKQIISGMPTSDGAGVELVRVIGQPALEQLDPFLLLDVFRSDNPDDYIAGFPPHPHRGFETVTYLLNGRMRHKDNKGHEGVIEPGGIQWMTAASGIVHSEMPEQEDGLLQGFQLWINLPAGNKMDASNYQEHGAEEIPLEIREDGSKIKVITGSTSQGTIGPVKQPLTDPLYLDVELSDNSEFIEPTTEGHNAFIFVISGQVEIAGEQNIESLNADQLGIFGGGNSIQIRSRKGKSRFLIIAGKPLNEPIARGGPFVMNTQAEIKQAFSDYQAGLL